MNKKISKAIMDRTRLRRNRFLRTRSNGDTEAYNKQRNYCVSLIRKIKLKYNNNLDHRKIADHKSFWKYIKPLFSNKNCNSEKLRLVEKGNFFTSVVSNLNISIYQDTFIDSDQTENRIGHPILRIIEQYKNHHSIVAINNQNIDKRFSF